MRNQRKWVLAAGAAMMFVALAGVPRDAKAWDARRLFRIPADIVERLTPPTRKAPADDVAARRATVAKAGLHSMVSTVRRTAR